MERTNKSGMPDSTLLEVALNWTDDLEEVEGALESVRASIPDDMAAYTSVLMLRVLETLEGAFSDETEIEELTKSISWSLREEIRGYRLLGRVATNPNSLPAQAFG